jgi:hypothetical protein
MTESCAVALASKLHLIFLVFRLKIGFNTKSMWYEKAANIED